MGPERGDAMMGQAGVGDHSIGASKGDTVMGLVGGQA